MSTIDRARLKNHILQALPAAEFDALSSALTFLNVRAGQTLHRAGEMIGSLHFVETGLVSVLGVLADGRHLETGLIGREGVCGVSAMLGAATSQSEIVCQSDGAVYRVSAKAIKEAIPRSAALGEVLLKYAHLTQVQAAQTAICNTHHDLAQRLARWLLDAHDRSEGANLSLTQDMIATVLGVRRSTVSIAASALQRASAIRYQHGRIVILDRAVLEYAACECYQAVATEYRSLFGRSMDHVSPTTH